MSTCFRVKTSSQLRTPFDAKDVTETSSSSPTELNTSSTSFTSATSSTSCPSSSYSTSAFIPPTPFKDPSCSTFPTVPTKTNPSLLKGSSPIQSIHIHFLPLKNNLIHSYPSSTFSSSPSSTLNCKFHPLFEFVKKDSLHPSNSISSTPLIPFESFSLSSHPKHIFSSSSFSSSSSSLHFATTSRIKKRNLNNISKRMTSNYSPSPLNPLPSPPSLPNAASLCDNKLSTYYVPSYFPPSISDHTFLPSSSLSAPPMNTPPSSLFSRIHPFVRSLLQPSWSQRVRNFKPRLPWNEMEIEKLKNSFVPLLSLASLFFVFLGPAYQPTFFSVVCASFFPLFFAIYCSHFFRFVYAFIKIRHKLKAWMQGDLPQIEFQNFHAIIVPSYFESFELLQDSISFLAKQEAAREHYVLVLAMEERELGYATKANALKTLFQDQFRDILITEHPRDIPGESPGKGSNVAWASQRLYDHLLAKDYPVDKVILTVADADAVMPALYFMEVEREVQSAPSKKFHFFTPAIFFARNPMDVPAPVRVTDAAWCVGVIQNLSNFCGLHFPCSTYSLSLTLAHHVGWWDTNEYAIGEDLHMFLKCFYLSNTEARSTPIFVPINLTNVQTDSYFSNLRARFVQARRHFQGFADSIYAFRQTFYPFNNDHTNFWVRFLCLMHVFEAQIVPAVSCLTFLAAPISFFFFPTVVSTPCFELISRVSKCMISPYMLLYFIYEYMHRFLDTSALWGKVQCTRTWSQFLDILHLPLSDILFVCLPSLSLSLDAIRVLLCIPSAKFDYKVAEKNIKFATTTSTLMVAASTTLSAQTTSSKHRGGHGHDDRWNECPPSVAQPTLEDMFPLIETISSCAQSADHLPLPTTATLLPPSLSAMVAPPTTSPAAFSTFKPAFDRDFKRQRRMEPYNTDKFESDIAPALVPS